MSVSQRKSTLSSRFPLTTAVKRDLSGKQSTSSSQWQTIITRFLPVGICLIAVMQWRAFRRRQKGVESYTASKWEINCYCLLPLRTVSRCWGYLADIKLPEVLRPPVYKLYSNVFDVNLSEAENEDLKVYPSLADFFARSLKQGVRDVDRHSSLVAPCDGTVLHFGTVDTEQVEQVKGVTYSLRDFLGEQIVRPRKECSSDFKTALLERPHEGNRLYQCVIYLAPGDYHRFHSPVEWTPTHRRHFSGKLLSVNPSIASWLPGLFAMNERAVYLGQWEHGFFSYTAVGATNVGTVKVYFDKTLQTNKPFKGRKYKELCLGNQVNLKRGEIMGEFRMGSTIVLIFEAPETFKFAIVPGKKVKMGQSLGNVAQNFVHTLARERMGTSNGR